METNRSARAWVTRLCLPLLASSVLWAAACSSAGNAASSETPSSETPTSPSSTGTASPSATAGFVGLVYVNQEGGYTFHYPDDWVVVEGKRAGSVVVYAPPGDPRSSPANVSISLTPVPEGTNLKSYYRQTVGFLGLIPGFRLESTHRESFADLACILDRLLDVAEGHNVWGAADHHDRGHDGVLGDLLIRPQNVQETPSGRRPDRSIVPAHLRPTTEL